jgi:hypothetical protein
VEIGCGPLQSNSIAANSNSTLSVMFCFGGGGNEKGIAKTFIRRAAALPPSPHYICDPSTGQSANEEIQSQTQVWPILSTKQSKADELRKRERKHGTIHSFTLISVPIGINKGHKGIKTAPKG